MVSVWNQWLREVMLFVKRAEQDHDNMPPTMQKALTYTAALQKHQCCGAYLHLVDELRKLCPPSDYDAIRSQLEIQFASGFMDPDLLHALQTTFPPMNPDAVAAFRPFVARIQQVQRVEKEAKEQLLEQTLRQADFEKIALKLKSDVDTLKAWKKDNATEALRNAKDMKYLRDRQKSFG